MADDNTDDDGWARLRFAIIGPLLAAPPRRGELSGLLSELSKREWQHPSTGLPIRFGESTLERWYYLAKNTPQDPVGVLRRQVRVDLGSFPTIGEKLAAEIKAQYELHPAWSYRLHFDNLGSTLKKKPELCPAPSYSTFTRYMKANGFWKTRRRSNRDTEGTREAQRRLMKKEVRSYESTHVHGLWHTDFHVGSLKVLSPSAEWVAPVLFGTLDDKSRLGCHLQWYLESECTENLVHGMGQAFMKRGLCRALMSDRGSAMLSEEFQAGLLELGIIHETTLADSPYQNGKMEAFWNQIEGRLLPMLEDVHELSLDFLNRATQAWLEQEYNRTRHEELKATPLERALEGPTVVRLCPDSKILKGAFRRRQQRTQRQSDGTISIEGRRFEIPSRYRQLKRVTVRYAKWDLGAVDLVDPRTFKVLSPIYPIDKQKNADKRRRSLEKPRTVPSPTKSGMLAPLLQQLMEDYAKTGLPPAYLNKSSPEESS